MAGLRVQDFDMLRRRANVSRSVTESGGLAWNTPKSWERQSVPFPAVLCDELAALMVGKGRDDLVFTDERGSVLRNSNWRARVFRPAVTKCQSADETFPTITPHDLRHTASAVSEKRGLGRRRLVGDLRSASGRALSGDAALIPAAKLVSVRSRRPASTPPSAVRADRSIRRSGRTWSSGSGTTSRKCGCTPVRPRTSPRASWAQTHTLSGPASSSPLALGLAWADVDLDRRSNRGSPARRAGLDGHFVRTYGRRISRPVVVNDAAVVVKIVVKDSKIEPLMLPFPWWS
jgi:hypothetical protein